MLLARRTMSPTLVTSPGTGFTEAEWPFNRFPATTAVAETTMGPRIVGTPVIENVPSIADVAVNVLKTVATAPAMGCALVSRSLPLTVVKGSGIKFTVTFGAVPIFPPRSTAVAPSVRGPTVSGAVKVNSYGREVAVNTIVPFTRKFTAATRTSSVAVTWIRTVEPAMTEVPAAGDVMAATGGMPLSSTNARYWPM